jgi:predicted metalloprotease with PDZ domain
LSLDTLMFDLFREASLQKPPFPDLTPDRVLQAASQYIDPEQMRQLRSYVGMGFTVEAPTDAFGPCVTRLMVDMPSFEVGMNRTELTEKHLVTDLKPGSKAEKSGLKEGDRVIGTSVYWNDTSKPVKLTIRRGNTTSAFEYYPQGRSVGIVPQYAADTDRFQADPQSCRAAGAIY